MSENLSPSVRFPTDAALPVRLNLESGDSIGPAEEEDEVNRNPLDRATACCLSIACRDRAVERTARAQARWNAEVEAVLAHLLELDLPLRTIALGVLVPVEEYLLARFGPEEGRRLNDRFEEAFEAASRSLLAAGGPGDRRRGAGLGVGRG